MQAISKVEGNITYIPNITEKYISSLGQLRFMDSAQFLLVSLGKLVKVNVPEAFQITAQYEPNQYQYQYNTVQYQYNKYQPRGHQSGHGGKLKLRFCILFLFIDFLLPILYIFCSLVPCSSIDIIFKSCTTFLVLFTDFLLCGGR